MQSSCARRGPDFAAAGLNRSCRAQRGPPEPTRSRSDMPPSARRRFTAVAATSFPPMSPMASSVFASARCRSPPGLTLHQRILGRASAATHRGDRGRALSRSPETSSWQAFGCPTRPYARHRHRSGLRLRDWRTDEPFRIRSGRLQSAASKCSSSAAATNRASSARRSRSSWTGRELDPQGAGRWAPRGRARAASSSAIRLARTSRAATGRAVGKRGRACRPAASPMSRSWSAQSAEPERPPLENRTLTTSYTFKAKAARTYRLRQIASLIPRVTHLEPDFQAVRQVALAHKRGFEAIRAANRQLWSDLWKGRIKLVGADRRWQALADAAALLPDQFDACGLARVDLDLRARDLARLPLLLRPRDVGHRDFRRPGSQPAATARRRKASSIIARAASQARPATRACAAAEACNSLGRARPLRDRKPRRCQVPHPGMRITCRSMWRGHSRSTPT